MDADATSSSRMHSLNTPVDATVSNDPNVDLDVDVRVLVKTPGKPKSPGVVHVQEPSMVSGAAVAFTVLVPTLNEAANIDPLLGRVFAALDANLPEGVQGEVLVVDGGSTDGTKDAVRAWGDRRQVRFVAAGGEGGLSGDLLRGVQAARGAVVVVMDADLSHPPEALWALLSPVLAGEKDVVVGSRYVPGGDTPGWPWSRRVVSKVATWLAWPLVGVKDPMSGFFAVRKENLVALGGKASGFKIALEVLARGEETLRVGEVPIRFVDRTLGESKMGTKEVFSCLRQVVALAGGSVSMEGGLRFGLVGLSGLVVDLLVFNVLVLFGWSWVVAHIAGFVVATGSNYVFNARWGFAAMSQEAGRLRLGCWLRFLTVCGLALGLRCAWMGWMVEQAGWSPVWAVLVAVLGASGVTYIGSAFFVFPQQATRSTAAIRWRVLAMAVVAFSIVLRFGFAGSLDLMPEEAYYWQYAQHLDIGYLDHPPMVSWLIALSTHVFGTNEWAVRVPAMVCWLVMLGFVWATAHRLLGKTVGFRTAGLVAVLPGYFSVGLLTTPDAPLHAAWAGALYFLVKALLDGKAKAWLGVGVCVGLGMLSKYTIALLGPATVVFWLLDPSSRKQARTVWPWLSVLVALVLFSPVIVWNAMHDWASFAFQGSRRWSGSPEFSLHMLIGSVLLLLTPMGAIGVWDALLAHRKKVLEPLKGLGWSDRRRLFTWVFVCVPLSVFVLHSLQDNPKLNWTSPVWLAALPWLAWGMVSAPGVALKPMERFGQSLWRPMWVGLLLFYALGLSFMWMGCPGMPAQDRLSLPIAWQQMHDVVAEKVQQSASGVGGAGVEGEALAAELPVVVGMDKYFIASEQAFYAAKEADKLGDVVAGSAVTGRHLFGEEALMWAEWSPAEQWAGRDCLLVAFNPDHLAVAGLADRFASLGPVEATWVTKSGREVVKCYTRLGRGYVPDASEDATGEQAVALRTASDAGG